MTKTLRSQKQLSLQEARDILVKFQEWRREEEDFLEDGTPKPPTPMPDNYNDAIVTAVDFLDSQLMIVIEQFAYSHQLGEFANFELHNKPKHTPEELGKAYDTLISALLPTKYPLNTSSLEERLNEAYWNGYRQGRIDTNVEPK